MKIFLLFLANLFTLLFCVVIPETASSQWSSQLNLSPSAISAQLNESMGSCLGVSNDTVHVVWVDRINPTHGTIYYTHSIDTGLSWSSPVAITNAAGNAWNPAIAVSGQNIHVVWREIDTITNARSSWYEHSTDGGNTWGTAIYIDSTSDWPGIAVSGSYVYIVNDRHVTTSNSEIFFLRSLDNGLTWSGEQQLTFANLRSEDEAITAQGSYIHMSWNDNRTGQFQIFYKDSKDYGLTWGADVVVDLPFDYNTMVSIDGAYADVIACGAPTGHYQLLLAQSPDTGTTWTIMNNDLSNDTAHTYFLPHMTRDNCNLHVVCNSSAGAKYFHSGDGGTTWDAPSSMAGVSFIAYTGNVLHVIYVNSGRIYYLRNPTGNAGTPCSASGIPSANNNSQSSISISPNPFTEELKIKSGMGEVVMFDITGKEMLSQKTMEGVTSLNTAKLSPGFYILRFSDGKATANFKVTKQ